MPTPTPILFIGNSFTRRNDLPGMLERLAAAGRPARSLETEEVIANGMSLKTHWTRGQARRAIGARKWEYVVLQEQSTLPLKNRAKMHEYATLFARDIQSAGAKPVLYMTWARLNAQDRQDELADAYLTIGRELGVPVAPVGLAWQTAFKRIPGVVLHDKDGSHPNPLGTYLAACVFYGGLFDKTPVGLPADPLLSDKFSAAPIQSLQDIAWHAVTDLR